MAENLDMILFVLVRGSFFSGIYERDEKKRSVEYRMFGGVNLKGIAIPTTQADKGKFFLTN